MTMKLISTVTVGAGGAASIDFASIPGTYTDLLIVASIRSALVTGDASDGVFLRFNGSTSGYTTRDFYGNGASAASSVNPYGVTSATFVGSISAAGSTSSTFGSQSIYIANYASATNKNVSTDSAQERNASSPTYLECLTGVWANGAAITSLSLFSANSSTWAQYSTASLYGITKGTLPGVIVT